MERAILFEVVMTTLKSALMGGNSIMEFLAIYNFFGYGFPWSISIGPII
jgi:hypothetical protein